MGSICDTCARRLTNWTSFAKIIRMLTRQELAELLRSAPVNDISRLSGVAPKTIYRLRHEAHSPTLRTVERLVSAVRMYRAGGRK